MHTTNQNSDGSGDAGVILASSDDKYWLLQGEQHLTAMLAGDATYPTPVRAVEFESAIAMEAFLLEQGVPLVDLWSIHPAIIARMIRDDELVSISAP